MSWTQEQIDSVFLDARKRATTDKSFRTLLISSPNKAIEQLSGNPVPKSVKIKVVESDPNYHMTFVLPKFVGDELSTGELGQVAGGEFEPCAGKFCAAQATR